MPLRRAVAAVLAFLALLPMPGSAAGKEVVNDISVFAALGADGRIVFREEISYDFDTNERHGVYRDIPVDYRRYGGKYKLDLLIEKVGRDGKTEPYSVSTKQEQAGNVLSVRIGDPNSTMQGKHGYELAYSTERAVNFFDDHDELYWNVTGNGWDVPIEKASFLLTLPQGVSSASVTTTCYTGVIGSTVRACKATAGDGVIAFEMLNVLAPSEGLTIVVGFPKGIIREPTKLDRALAFLVDNRSLFFPIIALVVMFSLWRVRGKDPALGTIIPQYGPPDDLAPAIVQTVWSYGNTGDRAITSTIIDLARRGYLHISIAGDEGAKVRAEDFTLLKKKEADDGMSAIEKFLFKGSFSGKDAVTLADLKKGKFYETVMSFKRSVHEGVEEMHVFEMDPGKVRGLYILAGLIIGGGLYYLFSRDTFVDQAVAVLTGLIIIGFGWHMPRRTNAGTRLHERIEGFKWFLSVTETERMAFHDAPQRRPAQFSEFLAYAIVFGVEDKWAAQFAGLDIPPPQWAEGRAGHMNAIVLASAMHSFHDNAHGIYAPPSSQGGSGGSGFSGGGSGGGMGGGGGGSW